MLGVHVSRYRPDGVVVVIVVNAVEQLAASQPGLRLRLHLPRRFCSQERQYPSKRQLLSFAFCRERRNSIDIEKTAALPFKIGISSANETANRNNFRGLSEVRNLTNLSLSRGTIKLFRASGISSARTTIRIVVSRLRERYAKRQQESLKPHVSF